MRDVLFIKWLMNETKSFSLSLSIVPLESTT